MKVVALYSLKGGVGKTASAVNLAWLAARQGLSTLLWDMDPQGAASFYFRTRPKGKCKGRALIRRRCDAEELIRGSDFDHLDLLPADFSYRKMELELAEVRRPRRRIQRLIRPLRDRYELLLLDSAPGISRLAEAVFVAADALLIPVIPTTLSLRTLTQLLEHLRKRKSRRCIVMPFLSMVDRRKNLHRQVCEELADEEFGFLRSEIPYCSAVEQMGLHRSPVFTFSPRSPAAAGFERLGEEVRQRLREGNSDALLRPEVLQRLGQVGRRFPAATASPEREAGLETS